jgi:hypothetical protein
MPAVYENHICVCCPIDTPELDGYTIFIRKIASRKSMPLLLRML